MGTLFICADAGGLNVRPTAAKRATNADKTQGMDDLPGRAAIYVAIIARKIPARPKRITCAMPRWPEQCLTRFHFLPYKSYDSVLYGNPVQIRNGPATVSAEERSEYATGAFERWEGSFNPKKRKPGDRPSSHRFESTSKERSMTIPD